MTSPDIKFFLVVADALRRLAEAPDASLAERAHWTGYLDEARRLVEQQAAQDGAMYAAVNDRGYVVGEKHHMAKLSDADIELIHELGAEGLSHARIAAKFDAEPKVSRATVGRVLRGEQRAQTTMGHRLVARGAEPIFWPASPDEFEVVLH